MRTHWCFNKFSLVAVFLLMVMACNSDGDNTDDLIALNALLEEIEELAMSEVCEDGSEWRFTALGAKPCGGPSAYIAYSSKLDTLLFLEKVNRYTEEVKDFNIKTGAISDCALVEEPEDVICKNGNPVFTYRLE